MLTRTAADFCANITRQIGGKTTAASLLVNDCEWFRLDGLWDFTTATFTMVLQQSGNYPWHVLLYTIQTIWSSRNEQSTGDNITASIHYHFDTARKHIHTNKLFKRDCG